MRKTLFLLIAIFSLSLGASVYADPPTDPPKDPPVVSSEGMWLPIDLNFEHMKALGLKLNPEDIYSTESPSIKDAIVQLGGFCTGEIISPQGLMLTNHHCGYDAIASQSSVENDYLTDGFWAGSNGEEKPIEGLTATFLVRMEDVSKRVLGDDGDEADPMAILEAIEAIETEAIEGTDYRAEVKEVFHGAEYYLYVYETFRDIRLVGAPPSSIGKYGGDTDNWMWPRHTGDFSLFRVYAGADNKPADYSDDNVPYKPKHFLPISIKGVDENDYAMIMGYPGTTNRYLTSSSVDFALEQTNQDRIKLMGEKLGIMKSAMDKSDEVRINMASDYASLSNYHKYLIGQSIMLKRYDIVDMKEGKEKEFQKWAAGNSDRKSEYGDVLKGIEGLYSDYNNTDQWMSYLNFGILGPSTNIFAIGFYRLWRSMEASENADDYMPLAGQLKEGVDEHFENFYFDVDKDIFLRSIMSFYEDVPKEMHPAVFGEILTSKKAKKGKTTEDKFRMWTEWAFATSVTTNKERAKAFLSAPSMKLLQKDPIVYYLVKNIEFYRGEVAASNAGFEQQVDQFRKSYIRGMREMNPDKHYYPDANSTMRLTFGTVQPYYPEDAVFYSHLTTLDGVMEKEDPGNDEFVVPAKLKTLWKKKDFGDYGMEGKLPVNFLTTNDITGGNSGSPVINANGELIGCAFDGNWEAMASDIHVFPDVTRTISVDARYILFIIDKFAGATHLIDEMTIVKE